MNEHETGFLKLLTERTRSMESLLEGGPKRREDAREYLNHVEFDVACLMPLVGGAGAQTSILKALQQHGAPASFYVLSREPTLDGLTLSYRMPSRHYGA
jgi:hypothetical protein